MNEVSPPSQPIDKTTLALIAEKLAHLEMSARFAANHADQLRDAADKHVEALSVAVRYAFAATRKAMKKTTKDTAEKVMAASLEKELMAVLPGTLARVASDGARVAIGALGFRVAKAANPKIKFNAIDKRAVKWAREHSAELITDITETSRKAIKRAIVSLLKGESYHDVLDKILAAVGDDDRAELIARHETMSAVSAGQREAWDEAVEEGLLTGDEQRVWIIVPGACDECEPLDGETAPLDGEYPGGIVGPPLHPRCRCTEGIQ